MGSLYLAVTGVERWTGATAAPGYALVTVRVQVTQNAALVAPGTNLYFPGIDARASDATKLNWYNPKPGIVRQPSLEPGTVPSDSPLYGWVTFQVPSTAASRLYFVPQPGVYIRLY